MAVIMEIPYMDLDNIYMSRQTFCWFQIQLGTYLIVHKDKAVKVTQKKNMFHFSCSEEEFYSIWYKYFDLDTSYDNVHFLYKLINSNFSKVCTRCSGMHILNQDLFQVLVETVITENVGVRAASEMVYKLCKLCGTKHKQSIGGSVIWYEFPNANQIMKNPSAIELVLGRAAEPVLSICESIKDGWLDLDLLSIMDYYEAKNYLLDFDYMTDSEVEKICLLGLHIMSSMPVDKAVDSICGDIFECTFNDLVEWNLCETKYIEYIGYLMYVFRYNYFCPPTVTGTTIIQGEEKRRIYKKSKKLVRGKVYG